MFPAIILLRNCMQEISSVFVSYVGFQSDTLVNLDGDQVLNFALKQNTDQLQEVVIRQKSQYAEQIDFGTKD
jgi:hypothetical protein